MVSMRRKRNLKTTKEESVISPEELRNKIEGTSSNINSILKTARIIFFSSATVVLIFILWPTKFDPKPFNFKTVSVLDGPLSRNIRLSKTTKLCKGLIFGPESLAFQDGYIYAGTKNGVVRVKNGNVEFVTDFTSSCDDLQNCADERKRGRPLGLRLDQSGNLLVVDAYLGLFKVNVRNGSYEELIPFHRTISGHRPRFLNDVAVALSGMIYVTDTSVKWSQTEFKMFALELNADGRVIEYNPKTGEATALCSGISPNGIEVSRNQDYVIICNTAFAKLEKCYIRGEKRGQTEPLVDNLPGFPDNIRRSSSGGYWIGVTAVRGLNGTKLMTEVLGPYPFLRHMLYKWKIFTDAVKSVFGINVLGSPVKSKKTYGLVIEIDENGNYLQSLHDPTGNVVGISHAEEHDGKLFLGSATNDFIGMLDHNEK